MKSALVSLHHVQPSVRPTFSGMTLKSSRPSIVRSLTRVDFGALCCEACGTHRPTAVIRSFRESTKARCSIHTLKNPVGVRRANHGNRKDLPLALPMGDAIPCVESHIAMAIMHVIGEDVTLSSTAIRTKERLLIACFAPHLLSACKGAFLSPRYHMLVRPTQALLSSRTRTEVWRQLPSLVELSCL